MQLCAGRYITKGTLESALQHFGIVQEKGSRRLNPKEIRRRVGSSIVNLAECARAIDGVGNGNLVDYLSSLDHGHMEVIRSEIALSKRLLDRVTEAVGERALPSIDIGPYRGPTLPMLFGLEGWLLTQIYRGKLEKD
jgi:hypothetical protein